MPDEPEGESALADALRALDTLDIPWAITGSFAMAAYGTVRATQDADIKILVDQDGAHEEPLATEMRRRGFSRIDEHTFETADRFVVEFYPVAGRLDEATFWRRRRVDALPSYGEPVWVVILEDLILLKLREFLRTQSHVQLDDVRALLVAHNKTLDVAALGKAVEKHGLDDAWQRVVEQAGRDETMRD